MVETNPKASKPIWQLVTLRNRADAPALTEITNELGELVTAGNTHIALDLKNNRFICLQAIYYIVGLAENLANRGGKLVFVSCPEKTKRHFEIYASLKHVDIVRHESDLGGEIVRVTRSPQDPVQELP